jgi:hypothetical protein
MRKYSYIDTCTQVLINSSYGAGILTCTVDVKGIGNKAKMLIILVKGPKYDDAVAAAAAAREARNVDTQQADDVCVSIACRVSYDWLIDPWIGL